MRNRENIFLEVQRSEGPISKTRKAQGIFNAAMTKGGVYIFLELRMEIIFLEGQPCGIWWERWNGGAFW